MTAALGTASFALFLMVIALGLYVRARPLVRIDAWAVWFRSQGTRIAVLFTKSGRSRGVTICCTIAILVYALLHAPLWIPVLMMLSQILSQTIVEGAKLLFRRVRPDYWLVGLDAGHSYPSGHAATAVIFFCGWAAVLAVSGVHGAVADIGMALLGLWALGIAWSRLALGAHYLTDVIGGVLFGCAWVCGAIAILSHFMRILR